MSNTGYKYIYKGERKSGSFDVIICGTEKNIRTGTYNTLEEAIQARNETMVKNGLTLYLDK